MESSIPSSSTLGDNRSKNPLRFFFTFLSSITRFLGVAIFIIVVVRAVVWAVGPYLADIFESWRPLIIGIQKFLEIEPYSKVPNPFVCCFPTNCPRTRSLQLERRVEMRVRLLKTS